MKYLNVMNLAFLVLVIILSQNSVTFAQQNDLTGLRKSSFTYEAVIKKIPENTGTVYIWLPLPSSDDYQEITNLTVKSLFPHKETQENKYGNRILFIDASGCKVTELHIRASFEVKRREHHANIEHAEINEKISDLNADELEMFLQPSRLAVIDDEIKSIATTITREQENPLRKARAIYDYLIRKMEYNKEVPGWGRGDTKRAITVCKGNCSDFHSAFTSLAIAGGVPLKI